MLTLTLLLRCGAGSNCQHMMEYEYESISPSIGIVRRKFRHKNSLLYQLSYRTSMY